MRKKNRLIVRDDLSIIDNFFQSSFKQMTDKLMSRRMASHYLGTSKRYLKALTQVGRMFPEKSFPERWSKQDLDRYKQEIGRDITPDLEASLIRSAKTR